MTARAAALLAGLLAGCAAPDHATLWQTSTIRALLAGAYDGAASVGEVRAHGDLGLGTFEALDGEMVVVDGRVWRVRADGRAEPVSDGERTPFACVVRFAPTWRLTPGRPLASLAELERFLDERLPRDQHPYAIRVTGAFAQVRTRSVPRQAPPYRRLAEIAPGLPVFTLDDRRGVVVGFRFPPWAEALNVPGYHFHFLDAERTTGGHVLDLRSGDVTIEVAVIRELAVAMPASGGFHAAPPAPAAGDLEAVERLRR